MGTRCALEIKDKTNVLYMNTMNDGFPKKIVPEIKEMVDSLELFLKEIEFKCATEVKSPLLMRWVPKMKKLIAEFKENPTVEVAGLLTSQLGFHLFRFIPWHTNPNLDGTYPIQKKLGEIVYNLKRNTVVAKRNPVNPTLPEPRALSSDRKLLRIKYYSNVDELHAFICDVSVPASMTQNQINHYLQEMNSLEVQLAFFAQDSSSSFAKNRYDMRNYDGLYKISDSSKEILGISHEKNSRLIHLLDMASIGYHDVIMDYFARDLAWVSAGEILPLNEANALWAKQQPHESVDFIVNQFMDKQSKFRIVYTEFPADDLSARIEAFNEYQDFVLSVKPNKKIYREYFSHESSPNGVQYAFTFDMIRLFEFFSEEPHSVAEQMVEFEKNLPLIYTFSGS